MTYNMEGSAYKYDENLNFIGTCYTPYHVLVNFSPSHGEGFFPTSISASESHNSISCLINFSRVGPFVRVSILFTKYISLCIHKVTVNIMNRLGMVEGLLIVYGCIMTGCRWS